MNKRKYNKGSECELCGTTNNIEFHHFYSLTLLFEKWVRVNKLTIQTDNDVLVVRDRFSDEHKKEIFDETITICKAHHAQLHSIYGITPALHTAEKQKRWVQMQAEKLGRKYEFKTMADRET